MLYDKDIREPLFDYLESLYGKSRMLQEKIMGSSRADIVMVCENGIYGIEIKSDRDSYARLSRQIRDYDLFFDYNYVVVGGSHGLHIREHVPEHWGIITVEELLGDEKRLQTIEEITDSEEGEQPGRERKKLDFYMLRRPSENPYVQWEKKLSLLWRPELASIQEKNSMPAYKKLSKKNLILKILERVERKRLLEQISEELFQRDYTTIAERLRQFRIENGEKVSNKKRGQLSGKAKSICSGRRKKRRPSLLVSRVVKGKSGKRIKGF